MNIVREEIRTGLLVVVSLAVLVTLMLYLGAPGVFVPQKTYYIYVDNAAGLKQGADVSLAGRKIGQVVKLNSPVPEKDRPEKNKETMVEVKVNRSAQVYKTVKVTVTQTVFGEATIDFASGVESSGEAPDKSSFLAEKAPGLDQAVPMVLERLDPALKKATETLDSLQKTADNLTKLTSETGEIPVMLAEFRKVGTNLDVLSGKDGPLTQAISNVASLTGPEGKIHEAAANIETLTAGSGSLAKALLNAEKFTADLASNKDIKLTLENSRRATAELNETLTELRFKFSAIADNLNQASDTVKHQPWRLIWPTTKKYPEAGTPPAAPPRDMPVRRATAVRR